MTRKTIELVARLARLGLSTAEAMALRRIEMTLHRWAERECGDGSDWAIERDDATGRPYNVRHGNGRPHRYAIADREAGALRRLAVIMAPHRRRLVAYHQGDPRGCALYIVPRKYLKPGDKLACLYTRGFAVCE